MKKPLFLLTIAVLLMIAGCAANTPTVRRTYEQTPLDEIESRTSNHEEVVLIPYEELSDGSWRAQGIVYPFRLELTGRLPHAACDSTYVLLSQNEDISFEQAWKAGGLSSDLRDYFDAEASFCLKANRMRPFIGFYACCGASVRVMLRIHLKRLTLKMATKHL